MKEIWKDIKGFEGLYQVSDAGRIKSLSRYIKRKDWNNHLIKDRILKYSINPKGYKIVGLYDGKKSTKTIHRLVATAFIPNPENKRTINHKNGIKTDNDLTNLEWATYSENGLHSYRELGRVYKSPMKGKYGKNHNRSKSVSQFSLNGEFIKEYECIRDAERLTGVCNTNISNNCKGKAKTAGGYIWRYAADRIKRHINQLDLSRPPCKVNFISQ